MCDKWEAILHSRDCHVIFCLVYIYHTQDNFSPFSYRLAPADNPSDNFSFKILSQRKMFGQTISFTFQTPRNLRLWELPWICLVRICYFSFVCINLYISKCNANKSRDTTNAPNGLQEYAFRVRQKPAEHLEQIVTETTTINDLKGTRKKLQKTIDCNLSFRTSTKNLTLQDWTFNRIKTIGFREKYLFVLKGQAHNVIINYYTECFVKAVKFIIFIIH